jgi:hypothetical protein
MIQKMKNNIVLAYFGIVLVFVAESVYSGKMKQSAWQKGTKRWSMFALSSADMSSPFHIWCHDSLRLVLKFQACHFELQDLM